MIRYTVRAGEISYTIEAETVDEIVALRNALEPNSGGWIEYDGEGMPVDGSQIVDVKLRSGEVTVRTRAMHRSWRHYGLGGDIVAYKVVENG